MVLLILPAETHWPEIEVQCSRPITRAEGIIVVALQKVVRVVTRQ